MDASRDATRSRAKGGMLVRLDQVPVMEPLREREGLGFGDDVDMRARLRW